MLFAVTNFHLRSERHWGRVRSSLHFLTCVGHRPYSPNAIGCWSRTISSAVMDLVLSCGGRCPGRCMWRGRIRV